MLKLCRADPASLKIYCLVNFLYLETGEISLKTNLTENLLCSLSSSMSSRSLSSYSFTSQINYFLFGKSHLMGKFTVAFLHLTFFVATFVGTWIKLNNRQKPFKRYESRNNGSIKSGKSHLFLTCFMFLGITFIFLDINFVFLFHFIFLYIDYLDSNQNFYFAVRKKEIAICLMELVYQKAFAPVTNLF